MWEWGDANQWGPSGDGRMSVALATTEIPRRVGGGRRTNWARACGLDLVGYNVRLSTLHVDRPRVPVVDDGEVGADLSVAAGTGRNSPGQAQVSKNPLGG